MIFRQLKSQGCRPQQLSQTLFSKLPTKCERSFSSDTGHTNIMSWESPPVHRHLSTIGIGPVFVCPPPHPLRPQSQSVDVLGNNMPPPSASSISDNEILTWEIVGKIKTSPEDFVVREIGWAPTHIPDLTVQPINATNQSSSTNIKPHPTVVWSRKIAGLNHSEDQKTAAMVDGANLEKRNENEMTTTNEVSPSVEEKIKSNYPELINSKDVSNRSPALPTQHETNLTSQVSCTDPAEGLRRILYTCYDDTNNINNMTESQTTNGRGEVTSITILKELSDLQNVALDEIDSASSPKIDGQSNDDKSAVWISIAKLDKDSRTLLHRYIRQAFPLLRTETPSTCNADENVGDGSIDSIGTKAADKDIAVESTSNIKSWVCAMIDRTYFSIAQCLVSPRQDLLALYTFRNNGPVAVLRENGNRKSRKGGSRHQSIVDNDVASPCSNSFPRGAVCLRLRPDFPKNDRRSIHQALSTSRRREFETSTIHDVPTDDSDQDPVLTTAIVVQWSNQALKAAQKKRKREEEGNNKSIEGCQSEQNSDIKATFCVLRKYQCEHQVAISNIVRALKCRTGDIGLAGIKDMKAITFQFCTLRDVPVQRIHRANRLLGNRIQMMDMMQVFGSDSLLDRGKLIGNRFEITIRNMRRVKQCQGEGTQTWKEQMVPLHSSHLNAMVKRIIEFGFINFYGEQRVGDAGLSNHVGVRSFDVGRAMLRGNFSEAIDLIMTGRSNQVYNPGPEEINVRQVWKASGGDARQTLKSFPTNRNTMIRERDLLKGLVRYDDPLKAIRCIPHNVRVFWIHAYQSHVWNKIATERIRRWGLRPIIGDLFFNNTITDLKSDNVEMVNDPSSVNIFQIVLPLPGYNIQYPSHEIGDMYREILHDDGVELSKGDIFEATAKGSYRKLVQRANNLQWTNVNEHEVEDPNLSNDPVVNDARFTFDLDSGCYATMMLRELMVSTLARDNMVE